MPLPDPTNPYAKAHANPQGYGDARPTSIQIVEGEGLVNCMGGKVMLVTGSTSGIGVDTVRALHLTGADVYMQARDLKKAEAVRGDILGTSEGKGKLEIIVMDLNSLESIREGVKDFLIKAPKLNVLVNNAGTSSANPKNLRHELTITLQLQEFATLLKPERSMVSRHSLALIILPIFCYSNFSCRFFFPLARPRSTLVLST